MHPFQGARNIPPLPSVGGILLLPPATSSGTVDVVDPLAKRGIPTVTVGLGVTPNHDPCGPRGLYHQWRLTLRPEGISVVYACLIFPASILLVEIWGLWGRTILTWPPNLAINCCFLSMNGVFSETASM